MIAELDQLIELEMELMGLRNQYEHVKERNAFERSKILDEFIKKIFEIHTLKKFREDINVK